MPWAPLRLVAESTTAEEALPAGWSVPPLADCSCHLEESLPAGWCAPPLAGGGCQPEETIAAGWCASPLAGGTRQKLQWCHHLPVQVKSVNYFKNNYLLLFF